MNCSCLQQPRELIEGYAICACTNLVYQRAQIAAPMPFAPVSYLMNPWTRSVGSNVSTTNHWTFVVAPDLRRWLVQRAKEYIGPQHQAVSRDIVDATSAARAIGENVLANDIEYEQWVLLL